MWLVLPIFALELLDVAVSAQRAKSLPNVICQTHETIIPVDPINHGYYPFYVELHRCVGSASTISPKVQHCVAQRYEEINVEVYSRAENFRRATVNMKNHTSCAPECVASPSDCDLAVQDWDENVCACRCRYPDGPPKELACKEGFRWNNHICACECNQAPKHCPIRMTWSKDICGCKCDSSVVNDCTQMKLGIDVDCQCVDVKAFRRHKEDLKVAVDSASTESLEIAKESSDDDSFTAPLSPEVRVTNI
ncbi:hypothetical protein AWC38_SpisGene14855 [Stylophora pistillata]|uniref:Uncharacterized protein n=1 Tax=Stylophora pistillata TaxID=50429 RepID=A0A2B4RU43_STYPI|nr:hypothetical protein AWC38_SpisGene14855 [Stylophora pistillata]